MTASAATRRQEPVSDKRNRKRVITRFAPSPTGLLHLGHAFSALAAHDFARERCGRFLLRIEDIDPGRARRAFIDAIMADLAWLGIGWDGEVIVQSQRLPIYAEALDRLKAAGLAYPCFCTRAEIAASAAAPHGPAGAVYPGTCRELDPTVREARMAGEAHAWRLDMARAVADAGSLEWCDLEAGMVAATPETQGDVVLARKDAPVSYHLAVVVDDAAQGVTHVIRGRDLYEATHVHRLLQALLGLPVPVWRHHELLMDASGKRLAKRDGAPTIAGMREGGVDPARLVAELRNRAAALGFAG